nr:hypothetical protein [uncultured Mucilaginibacter sp.]
MEFLLLLVAPVLQIILSALRLARKISLPLFLIFWFAIITGIACSVFISKLVMAEISAQSQGRYICGLPGFVFLMGGLFVSFISASVIAFVCYFLNRGSQSEPEAEVPAVNFWISK